MNSSSKSFSMKKMRCYHHDVDGPKYSVCTGLEIRMGPAQTIRAPLNAE